MTNSSIKELYVVSTGPALVIFPSIGTIGVIGNAAILACQYASPALRHCLVAALAVSDLCCSVCFIIGPMIAKPWSETQRDCVERNTTGYLIATTGTSTLLTLFVATDRLLAVVRPLKYKIDAKWNRFAALLLCILVYPEVLVLPAWWNADNHILLPSCSPPSVLEGNSAFFIWTGSTSLINLSVVVVYCGIRIALRKNRQTGVAASSEHKHLEGSISIVVLLHVSTWLIAMAIVGIVGALDLDPGTAYDVGLYLGTLAVINVASNGYVYLWRSERYREALWKFVKLKKNVVGVTMYVDQPRSGAVASRVDGRQLTTVA